MPELPEVEATRRHLEPVLTGAVVAGTDVRRERMLRRQPRPADFGDRLTGRRAAGNRREGTPGRGHFRQAVYYFFTASGRLGNASIHLPSSLSSLNTQ